MLDISEWGVFDRLPHKVASVIWATYCMWLMCVRALVTLTKRLKHGWQLRAAHDRAAVRAGQNDSRPARFWVTSLRLRALNATGFHPNTTHGCINPCHFLLIGAQSHGAGAPDESRMKGTLWGEKRNNILVTEQIMWQKWQVCCSTHLKVLLSKAVSPQTAAGLLLHNWQHSVTACSFWHWQRSELLYKFRLLPNCSLIQSTGHQI